MSIEASSIEDNPCWGGPEPNLHDLEYLLRVLGSSSSGSGNLNVAPDDISFSSSEEYDALIERVHQKLIIFQDDNFLAIHKPADLRMDGKHKATVHKLLLYLYPPPSLEKMVSEELLLANSTTKNAEDTTRDSNEAAAIQKRLYHEQLLKFIAPLAKRNCLKDDPFRMAHQLDYATSGVLLLGKTRKSTGVASQAFEMRKTNKQYVAVVINPPTTFSSSASNNSNSDSDNCPLPPFTSEFFDNLPLLPKSSLNSWGDGSLEKIYRKKRQRETDERERGNFQHSMVTCLHILCLINGGHP